MTINNIFLLSQSAVYTVSAIVSLCVWIPMSLNLYQFGGHCLLFTSGQYVEEDGTFDPNWSSPAYCGFTLFVGISVFLVAFIQSVRKIVLLCKGIDRYLFNRLFYFINLFNHKLFLFLVHFYPYLSTH